MIKRVSANQESFRGVEFGPAFNLVLAERSEAATGRDSRNGLGKSLLLEIFHFCMGARATKDRGVVVDALSDWEFTVDLVAAGADLRLSRAVAEDMRKWIYVDSNIARWPVDPELDEGKTRFKTPGLNTVLGRLMFQLTEQAEATKWGPTYRSLVSYLMRRGPDGFLDPFLHDRNQQEWDKQVNVGHHLGLNWPDAAAIQQLRVDKKFIDRLAAAAKEGTLPSYLGSEGALEAERVRLDREIAERTERLARYEVNDDYVDIEAEANRLTEQIHQLINENLRDRRYRDLYAARIEDENEALVSGVEVETLFKEVNVVLPEQVAKRLDELRLFHDAVVQNRRDYLTDEIAQLDRAIELRERTVAELDGRKAELMTVLESTGALDEYTRLQDMLVELRGRLHDVNARLERLREVTQAKEDWEHRKNDTVRRARTRYNELRVERDRAIAYFDQNTQALYEAPGRLIIDVSDKGFEYGVEIERSDSHGVSNMKVFCFDLMLMQMWSHETNGPGVLVHDSSLFDGVDERQVAAALSLAHSESERLGFQYICTMNSDDLPVDELGQDSPVFDHVVLRLRDDEPSGMLLGIEF